MGQTTCMENAALCMDPNHFNKQIIALERLHSQKQNEKLKLQTKIEQQIQIQNDDTKTAIKLEKKIDQMQTEKKQLFKSMMQEKKTVGSLYDELDLEKETMDILQTTIETLTAQSKEAEKKASDAEFTNTELASRHHLFNKQQRLTEVANTIHTFHDLFKINKNKNDHDVDYSDSTSRNDLFATAKMDTGVCSDRSEHEVYTFHSTQHALDGDALLSPRELTEVFVSDNDESKSMNIDTNAIAKIDEHFDANTDAAMIFEWVTVEKPKSTAEIQKLKRHFADLLPARTSKHRQELCDAYEDTYGCGIMSEVRGVLEKGLVLDIIDCMLQTRAEFDAVLLNECIANWDLDSAAEILCCRNKQELQALKLAYSKSLKMDIVAQLCALAKQQKKNTLLAIVIGMFGDPEEVYSSDSDVTFVSKNTVNTNDVNEDIDFLLKTKKFKGDTKEKLCKMLMIGYTHYLKVLNEQFKLKSSNKKEDLLTFIDKKIGSKSTAGKYCKIHVQYCINPTDYYANAILKYGHHFEKDFMKIAQIFIQRMEVDLDQIQYKWIGKKYGNGKSLIDWLKHKEKSKSTSTKVYFLVVILQNCKMYSGFDKK